MNLRFLPDGTPLNVGESIVNGGRHDVNVFTEGCCRVDSESGASLNDRKRFPGIVVEFRKRKVHNLWFVCHKVMDGMSLSKRRLLIKTQ